ncbi:polyprenyl synthetase family protein [Mycolicibacterium sp. P1-18]|uniref:polyprenyl synthetase family protein n=1 Tax=Mycolicibacterium sp. P1-18 TaxID=2024615 RepID=UPI0011F2D93B|nr:polyprenyl synthetase family protein [Mycolicibacterium sp. P1-18]KAA0092784.1 polyprenyl synthetase family protein [Mycolicibacterium sp. P1-18]
MNGDDHDRSGLVLSRRRQRGHRPSPPVRAARGSLDVRGAVQALLADFVATECLPQLDGTGVAAASQVLSDFLDGGKYVRSTFMYLGWLCGAEEDESALRASASLELLHAFALLQDDVMDESALRRGRPAAHVALSAWHRGRGLTDSSDRFGESAATVLGDLCLVWGEKMLRQSGVGAEALARVWPRYDDMRVELAVGQLADLVNDSHAFPTFEEVLDVARRKSGNYTVRRPLEIGAAMAGCGPDVVDAVGQYGAAIGEAFQLRDDLLGMSGSPTVTGKSVGIDLEAQKATSVVVAAYQLADAGLRRQLADLMSTPTLTAVDAERWRTLIIASGAAQWIEELIEERLIRALGCLDAAGIPQPARAAMEDMAVYCTERSA